jgi:uncharacterized protein YdaU (DUF1376 family)
MSTSLPWLKFFARDALADGLALDPATFGVCMRLRFAWWSRGGNLPDENRTLARLAGVTVARFVAMRTDLLSTGWQISNEGWYREDLRGHLRDAKANSDQARGAAKSRWKKETGNADACASEEAPAMPSIVSSSVSDKSNVSIAVTAEKATEADGDGDAAARAFQFIEVFDRSLVTVFGEKAQRKNPAQTDFKDAQQLIFEGVSLKQFSDACIAVMSRLPRDGSNTPGSISYVARDIRASTAAATRKRVSELALKRGTMNGGAHDV